MTGISDEDFLKPSAQLSVRTRARLINERLNEQSSNSSNKWNGRTVRTKNQPCWQNGKIEVIESLPKTLVVGGERSGTKLLVNNEIGAPQCRNPQGNWLNEPRTQIDVKLADGVIEGSSSTLCYRESSSSELCTTVPKIANVEKQGVRAALSSTSPRSISVHKSSSFAHSSSDEDQLEHTVDVRSRFLSDYQILNAPRQEVGQFTSSHTVQDKSGEWFLASENCHGDVNSQVVPDSSRPFLFSSEAQQAPPSSSGSQSSVFSNRADTPDGLPNSSDLKSDCDSDSDSNSSDSSWTVESIDQLLCSCEKIRDKFQTVASDLQLTECKSGVKNEHFKQNLIDSDDKWPTDDYILHKKYVKKPLCKLDERYLPCEAPGDEAKSKFKALLAYVDRECDSLDDTGELNCANDAFTMETRISPFHFNQRRSLKNRPGLRSYRSVSGISTSSASTESCSQKIQVRHKPDLPAYVTLSRKKLRKALSDPCEIADDKAETASPISADGNSIKEIGTILAELNFSKFKIKDEAEKRRIKNLCDRPLLPSIEKLGLKPTGKTAMDEKSGDVSSDEQHTIRNGNKLKELTEKLKLQDGACIPRTSLQRSHSITPSTESTSTEDLIHSRSASLPRRPNIFIRSASYSGAEDLSYSDRLKTSTWSPGMFAIGAGKNRRKDNRYRPLKGSNLPPKPKIDLEPISNVPIKCSVKNDLVSAKSDMSVDSAVDSVISDEGFGIENDTPVNDSSTEKTSNNSEDSQTGNPNFCNQVAMVPTRKPQTSLVIQEPGSSSFAEKRKRRKGMIFNPNNELSFDLSSNEPCVKTSSNNRSLTFPPQRKGSASDEPLFTSVDSNGLKSLNADQDDQLLQLSELSLADSHFCPSEAPGEESYHDVVESVTRKNLNKDKETVKALKKKHYSDPSGEKAVAVSDLPERPKTSDELSLPDIMLSAKSEPELSESRGGKRIGPLRLQIQDPMNNTQGGSQPNSPPAIAYDPSIFNKSNTLGPMTAPIRFDGYEGNEFENKFYCQSKNSQPSRRYSKKPLRGPYGEMLEVRMRKSQQQKKSEDPKYKHEFVEPGQTSSSSEDVAPTRKKCASNPTTELSVQQRSVDDIHLQRSHSDTGAIPKRKISTNIPPIPPAGGMESEGFLAPSQLSPSISVPNIISIESLPEWNTDNEETSANYFNLEMFYSKFKDTRSHVVGELFDTERSYVESLQVLVKKYFRSLRSPENAHLVDAHLVEDMFYRVPEILVHHEAFLEVLSDRLANWDNKQKVGDLFVDAFTKQPVIDTYTAFINNWKSAKEAIKTASTAKPAFAKFLEHMSREHKGKLTLDALLIMPVQRIPRYELLIKELLKHTQLDHPDHHPLVLAQKEVHDLALKINHMEREAQEAEFMQQKLRDLESLIEGLIDLVQPDRSFIRHDYVTMAGGLGTKKERCIFLFSDLLIITSIKRKTGTIRKTSSIAHSSPLASSTLEMNKYKLLMRFSLDDLEITKNSDAGITKALKEIESLEVDISLLGHLSEKSNSLNIPHTNLDEVLRELLTLASKQLTEKHSSDSVLLSMELTVTTQEGIECLNLMFSTPDRRTTFETDFDKAKKKLASTTDRRSPPEFISTLPIRKTRSGLELTCVAATIGLNSHDLKDVWICNSDGYIGQVCILSLQPEPTVASCNGVCNSRILCIASIPATNSISRVDVNYYRRRSTLTDKNMSGISISIEDTDDTDFSVLESPCSTNGNFQLDSDSSEDEEENESQDEDAIKQEDTSMQQQKDGENQQATMWLGTEDGYIHIYNCQDNIRIKKNKFKMQHGAAITCIIYLDNRVFVSLANGELAVYNRDKGDGWNTCDSQIVTIGSQNTPVTKMLAVTGKLWCGCQNNVMVVNTTSLNIEKTFSVGSDTSKSVLCMVTSGLGVWISVQNSAVIKLFHATSYECLFDVNVSPSVTKMLAVCDDIIRKHKSACLRVISLLTCKDLLWIGTSAGIILTLPLPHLTSSSTKITSLPNITGIPQGHTGNVKVLTSVEMTPRVDNNVKIGYNSTRHRYTRRSLKSKDLFNARRQSTSAALLSKLFVISGGYGYENFKNTSATEISGRDDSTNHLLLWQV